MAVVVPFPEQFQQAKPIIISSSATHVLIAIEVPRATLRRHRRFLEMLIAAAVEPKRHRETTGTGVDSQTRQIGGSEIEQERLTQLRESYAPYCRFPAFDKGFAAYDGGTFRNPHDPNTADAQAWDRGLECAMQWHHR
jgi:hypothetical protein